MRRVSSFVLAVLLTSTLLWGQCASCPLILPAPVEQHDCCGGDKGDCNSPMPDRQDEQCATRTLSPRYYDKAPDTPAPVPAMLPVAFTAADVAPAPVAFEPALESPDYSPPDLYLLNSAILA